VVAEGVENYQVDFGVDPDGDGFANYHSNAPTTDELSKVVNARVHVLVRGREAETMAMESQTYALGDVSITAPADKYLRRVYTGTASVRNVINSALMLKK
jgi:type IV pilus assembly protein PilW